MVFLVGLKTVLNFAFVAASTFGFAGAEVHLTHVILGARKGGEPARCVTLFLPDPLLSDRRVAIL
jgi:hypothetical protein